MDSFLQVIHNVFKPKFSSSLDQDQIIGEILGIDFPDEAGRVLKKEGVAREIMTDLLDLSSYAIQKINLIVLDELADLFIYPCTFPYLVQVIMVKDISGFGPLVLKEFQGNSQACDIIVIGVVY